MKRFIELHIVEILYGVVVVMFLFKLHLLNAELSEIKFASSWKLLSYHDFLPIKYFAKTILYVLIGIGLCIKGANKLFYEELEFSKMIEQMIILLMLTILIVLLIVFIDNPILRAVISIMAMGSALIYAISQ